MNILDLINENGLESVVFSVFKNLKGLEIEMVYNWKVGDTLIVDRTHLHCASSRIKDKKLGLTTFTKK